MLRAAPAAGVAALAAGLAVLATGCTPAPAWQQLELPAGVRAASVAGTGTGVLVGGVRPAGPAPALLEVTGARVTRELRLAPAEPYAEVAELISVTAADDRLYAIGRAFGGAHSNPRLTVWDGSLAAGTLTSRPQEFFTFGGHDAGPLLGTVALPSGPVIVGSRTTASGTEGVLWAPEGTTWHKRTGVDPALASSPDRVLGFTGAAGLGDRIVLTGDEVGLGGGLLQRPAVWTGRASGGWETALLPVPGTPPAVPGQLNRATSVACSGTDHCWVAGWAHGRPLVWRVGLGAEGRPQPAPPSVLPGKPPQRDPIALVAVTADRPVVLTGAAEPTLQLACPTGWRTLPAPPGRPEALAAGGGALYVVTAAGELWRRDAPGC